MTRVLLIHEQQIQHYRVAIYNYLSKYLEMEGFVLTVVSSGTEDGNPYPVEFDYRKMPLTFRNLTKLILNLDPDVTIYWVRVRNFYLFPTLLLIKILRKKAIYWGHGVDLLDKKAKGKKIANNLQYLMCDALILYGEHLKKYIASRFHNKVFVANNTLCVTSANISCNRSEYSLAKYNIKTRKNIICMGRMQKRKRIEDLVRAFILMDRPEYGLILVGPDTDGILQGVQGRNIYKLGAIFGDERLALLSASDVFCLPGHVGLSIVDAFYCGLPIVTEDVEHAPEIMYLKDGVNGFIVSKGSVKELGAKLQLLLEDDKLRERFSLEAKKEIMTNGHIDMMCKGFSKALRFVSHQ